MAASTLLVRTLVFLHVSLAFGKVVNLGSRLSPDGNDAWRSASGEFAFGFRQLNNNDTDTKTKKVFMVAIWYDKIPDKTVVWSAKKDNKLATALSGSKVEMTSEGLALKDPQGDSIWMANSKDIVSEGAMLDSGNFVLLNASSDYVWQSFDNPTDTLLPNQSLHLGAVLTSRFTDTNYTTGRFQLYFQDGNVFMGPLAWPSQLRYNPYYNAINASAVGNASRLVFDKSGDIYVETTNGTRAQLQGPKWGSSLDLDLNPDQYYYRATLDFTGVFTHYAHPRNITSAGWKIVRYVPDDICNAIYNEYGSGSCGYNSYCSIQNDRPTCQCLYGYSLVDPTNGFGGCQPNFTLACGTDVQAPPEQLYQMHESRNFNFPGGDYEKMQPSTQQECSQSCFHDCMCAVAILGGTTCWMKRSPLSNGRQTDVSDQHFVYIKTRVSPDIYPGENGELDPKKPDGGAKPILIGSLIASLVVNGILLATLALFILLKLLKLKMVVPAAASAASVSLLETNLHSFTYPTLEKATRGFSEEIGRGSYGIVYRGQLESTSCNNMVAVKRLDRLAQQREKEFRAELSAIGKTCHKNLVRLIGFCDEGINRLLVYEFMSNGTVADVLFGQSKPNWNVRVGFALGIARGLVYLHEECDTPIIHCDIKPQNILIDEHFNTKISDFGLAKLLLSDQSRTNTMIRGTRGYVAPEWFKNVPVTVKVDVYSYGVMLLEIICCRRSVLMESSGEEEMAILADWACDCYMEGRIDVLVENDEEALSDNDRLQKWVKIAIWCIHEQPEMRPTMGMVLQMLEGFVQVLNPPPLFSIHSII